MSLICQFLEFIQILDIVNQNKTIIKTQTRIYQYVVLQVLLSLKIWYQSDQLPDEHFQIKQMLGYSP